MKKNFAAGLVAVGLIVAGGTGTYIAYAKDNSIDPSLMTKMMKSTNMEEMMKSANMKEMMKSTDMKEMMKSADMKEMQKLMQSKGGSFEQMLPYMKKAHPNLNTEQLKTLYKNMHEKDSSKSCSNIMQGMMGKTSEK